MSSREARDAIWSFADALAWNWIIAGTDAHAKNYSLLLNRREVRLAPLYDISSILPYLGDRGPDGEVIQGRKLKMAMKVGGEYKLEPPRNTWRAAALELGLPPDDLLARVQRLATSAPTAFAAAAADPTVAGLKSEVIERLVEAVAVRASRCANILD
jgi:serine/threonine-protein kinase HipA